MKKKYVAGIVVLLVLAVIFISNFQTFVEFEGTSAGGIEPYEAYNDECKPVRIAIENPATGVPMHLESINFGYYQFYSKPIIAPATITVAGNTYSLKRDLLYQYSMDEATQKAVAQHLNEVCKVGSGLRGCQADIDICVHFAGIEDSYAGDSYRKVRIFINSWINKEITTPVIPVTSVSCSDGIKNQGEDLVDCGGPCEACSEEQEDNDYIEVNTGEEPNDEVVLDDDGIADEKPDYFMWAIYGLGAMIVLLFVYIIWRKFK